MGILGYRKLVEDRRVTAGFLLMSFFLIVYVSSFRHVGENIWDYDARFWYTAGTCWWHGESPYDREIHTRTWVSIYEVPPMDQATFVYPPTMALIGLPMALFSWKWASVLFRISSLLSAAGICYITGRLIASDSNPRPLLGVAGWYAGSCALLASLSQAVFQGQCSLIVVLGCLTAWYAYQRRFLWLFLISFLVATIKPKISMLPLLYILFSGGARWFFYGATVSGIFSSFMMLIVPLPDLVGAYESSMGAHLTYQYFNHWDWYSSVPALLGATPYGKQFMLLAIALGIAGVYWIARRQRSMENTLINRLRHQQLVWIIAMAAMPIHIYDLIGQVFVVMTLWALPGWPRRALVIVCMFFGDRVYHLAPKLRAHDILVPYLDLLRSQGPSVMAALLLGCFLWWYWRDYAGGQLRAVESTPIA